jgi:hypothetical protein
MAAAPSFLRCVARVPRFTVLGSNPDCRVVAADILALLTSTALLSLLLYSPRWLCYSSRHGRPRWLAASVTAF